VKRHKVDPVSLVAGLFFAVIGLLFLFTKVEAADLGASWVWPLPVLAVGLLMLTLGDGGEPEPTQEGESTPPPLLGDGDSDQ
jgi:hypothetical protein